MQPLFFNGLLLPCLIRNMNSKFFTHCFLLLNFLLVFSGLVSAENTVCIHGTISLTSFTKDGQIASNLGSTNLRFSYEVSLFKSGWLIKTIYDENTYYLTGSDGTNVYSRFVDGEFVPPKKLSIEIAESGEICAGLIPINNDQWTVFPWFVYCSGSIFGSRMPGDIMPVPWGAPRDNPITSVCEPKVVTFDQPPFLPKQCKFYVSARNIKMIVSTNFTNIKDKDTLRLQLNRYPDNFLAGEYRVVSSTNIAGYEIPLQFEGKRFGFPLESSSQSWIEQIYKGDVQFIQTQNMESPLPPIPSKKRFVVVDSRLRDLGGGVNAFSYEIKNGVWPAIIPGDAIIAFELNKKNKLVSTSKISLRRRIVWLAFFLIIVIPPYFIFRNKQNSK